MKRDIISSAIGIVVFTLLCGILYPLLVTGVSQLAFPGNANGQKVYVHGRLVGSKVIGQNFGDEVLGKNGKPKLQAGNPVTAPDPRYFYDTGAHANRTRNWKTLYGLALFLIPAKTESIGKSSLR